MVCQSMAAQAAANKLNHRGPDKKADVYEQQWANITGTALDAKEESCFPVHPCVLGNFRDLASVSHTYALMGSPEALSSFSWSMNLSTPQSRPENLAFTELAGLALASPTSFARKRYHTRPHLFRNKTHGGRAFEALADIHAEVPDKTRAIHLAGASRDLRYSATVIAPDASDPTLPS